MCRQTEVGGPSLLQGLQCLCNLEKKIGDSQFLPLTLGGSLHDRKGRVKKSIAYTRPGHCNEKQRHLLLRYLARYLVKRGCSTRQFQVSNRDGRSMALQSVKGTTIGLTLKASLKAMEGSVVAVIAEL